MLRYTSMVITKKYAPSGSLKDSFITLMGSDLPLNLPTKGNLWKCTQRWHMLDIFFFLINEILNLFFFLRSHQWFSMLQLVPSIRTMLSYSQYFFFLHKYSMWMGFGYIYFSIFDFECNFFYGLILTPVWYEVNLHRMIMWLL